MTLDEFTATLPSPRPPEGLRPPLRALWLAANDDWHAAHAEVQSDASAEASWVHAYLHRVEGDEGNAAYWYRRAGRPVATGDLPAEWRAIAGALLSQAG